MKEYITQKMTEETEQIKLKTFRFIYSTYFSKELEYFSKIHQFDDRKIFKKEWEKWIEKDEIKDLIEGERIKAIEEGYNGDLMDKIFKSARYYYRKKGKKEIEYSNDESNDEEKNFSGLSKEMMKIMDKHINNIINEYLDKSKKISLVNPAKAFDDFCISHINEIRKEIFKLKEKIVLKPDEINIKFKKSYKNRFYKIRLILNNK
jgi:hypothetical protein